MQEFLNNWIPNVMAKLPDFYAAIGDTLLMLIWSGAISFVLGLILGVLLTVTKPDGILENKIVYQILDKAVSLFRSIPFIILLTWVMPLSRVIMGTAIYVSPFSPARCRLPWPSWIPGSLRRRSPWAPAPQKSSFAST